MENKRADNTFLIKNEQINIIDDTIDREKQRQKKIENAQEELYLLNRNMNECIELLSNSIKGPNTDYIFDDMNETNRVFLTKTTSTLEDEWNISKKNVNQLYEQKENMLKENKNRGDENASYSD